ncbi:MAG: radical SAM protein [Candidatus Omnitrophica bacterium]|nr:radical SAM protein [Candidatus Omnitrophota bacterium]MDD5654061.1 radical SAM protein [Candidatus Omnitrophota bacterium]
MFMTTYACQLACEYCQVKQSKAFMPMDVFKKGVDLLLSTESDECQLRFWGGEPLLRWDLIQEGIAWAEKRAAEKRKTITFMITTNGLLLDQGKIDFLKKHPVKIMFSCDGDQKANQAHRLLQDGKKSSARLLANLKLLIRSGLPYFVHMIVTPSTVRGLSRNLYFLKGLKVEKVQLCYQDAVIWPAGKQKILLEQISKFVLSGDHYQFLMNFVNDCEPTILGHEILVDVDGKVYYDGAIFMEKRFPRLRGLCRLKKADQIKKADSLYLPRRYFYRIFESACGKEDKQVFLNNIGLGFKVDNLFNSLYYKHQSLHSNEHPLLIPIIKGDFASQRSVLGRLGIKSLFLYLETPCSNDCIFCRHKDCVMPSDFFKAELKLKDNLKIGAKKLCIIGNDPLLYPEIPEILGLAKKYGFREIEIMTSGESLADTAFCRALINKGASAFSLPIFSDDPDLHDHIVGRKGSFEKVIRGVKNALKYKAGVFIHTNLIKQNLDHIPALENFVRQELKAPFVILPIRPKTANLSFAELMPSYAEIIDKLRGVRSLLVLPLCVVQRIQQDKFRAGGSQISDSMKLYFLDQRFLKPGICKNCSYSHACPGLFKEYAQLYGLDEIKPIRR